MSQLSMLAAVSRPPLRLAAQIALWVVALLIVLWFLVNAMKRSTLFFPETFPSGLWDTGLFVPQPVDHTILTPDGVELHAWLFAADDPAAPLLIQYHGNGGNLTYRADVAEELARRGVSVLLFDYRGYGKSRGSPSEKALYIDGLAVYDYARMTLGFPAERIAVWGESLGGPYAADVASHRPVRCAVMQSTFPSAASVANAVYKFPVGFFLGDSLPTLRALERARVPVLVIHGDADTIIPFRCGKALHDGLTAPKELYVIPGADHNDLPLVGGNAYVDKVASFVRARQRPK
ncbi:MAG: alpha/beta hydrolase [Acidobacteria bacterium]|nr:alpha/beta hydrolase [Acidobacteriota bacterium]